MMLELESTRLVLRALTQKYAPNVCEFYEKNYNRLALWEPNLSKQFLLTDAMEIYEGGF